MKSPPAVTQPRSKTRFTWLTQLTRPRPLGVVIIGGYSLAGLMLGFEYWQFEKLIALPVYFLPPILGIAWYLGRWQAWIITVLIAGASFTHLLWREPLTSYSPVFLIARLLMFLVTALVAKPISTGRMMLEYLQQGDEWAALQAKTRVGSHLVIVSFYDSPPSEQSLDLAADDIPLYIRRGRAFGNASHPTTRMCLSLLESCLKPGDLVFDLGCGTGVLSIAAAKLGAKTVLAVDNDPQARLVTTHNISLNQVEEFVDFQEGSLEVLPSFVVDSQGLHFDDDATGHVENPGNNEQFDLVMANILTDTLIQLLQSGLARVVRPTGKLILSGILDEELEDFKKVLQSTSLEVKEIQQIGNWVAVAVRHIR